MLGRFAPKGRREPEPHETEREPVRREPLPLARAVLWKPLPDSYHLLASMMRSTEQQTMLFISQRAFLQVERHIRSAPDLEVGGFLAGHACECPRSRVRYFVVNTVVPFADVNGEPIGAQVTQAGFEKVRQRLDDHGLTLIGWYRNGVGLGLQLLPDDVETHVTYFDKPWQTAMLVVPDATKSKGAFFTYDPRVGRSYCIPFYELFDTHAAESKRLDHTCVTWTTYVASVPMQPLATGEREVVETTVAPLRSEPDPRPPEPIDEWIEAIKDPWVRLKAAARPAGRRDEPPPVVVESPGASPPVRPLKVETTREAAMLLTQRVPDARESVKPAAFTAIGGGASAQRSVAQSAPAPQILPHPVLAQPSPPPPPAQRGRVDASPARPGSARRASRRPAPPPVILTPSGDESALALPPDFHEEAIRLRSRRRIGLALAAASFLAVIGLSSLPSRTPNEAPPSVRGDAQEPAPDMPTIAMNETQPPMSSFPAAIDSLAEALAHYRAIADGHREGLVDCRLLTRAHRLVARARARLDSSRKRIAGGLTDSDSIHVSMLAAEYTFVAQTFERSGCRA